MARNFPNWLRAYMDYTRDSESPTPFHFWCGVSTVAGALRRRVWINMRKFDWTPNFYIVLVGPPGVAAKSTSMAMGMQLLAKVPDIKFGPESMTWQALAVALQDAIEYVEYIGPEGVKLRIGMSCLTVSVSELGTFLRVDDDQLMSFLIRMWEGQIDKFRHETKSSGKIEVDNPWLNVIGATTPAWLKQNFPEYMIGGGLTSRIVFVYGEKKRQLIPYPDEVIPDAEYAKLHKALLEDLTTISKLSGPYQLSTFAREWGRAWYAEHNNIDLRPAHLASDRYGGYLARKQTHLHKFAIILAAAKRDTLVIEQSDLEEAEEIITSIESDMIRVFESIGVVQERGHIHEIVSLVRFNGFITSQSLWTKSMNNMSMKDFTEAVKAAIHGNLLQVVRQDGVEGVVVVEKK